MDSVTRKLKADRTENNRVTRQMIARGTLNRWGEYTHWVTRNKPHSNRNARRAAVARDREEVGRKHLTQYNHSVAVRFATGCRALLGDL